MTTDRSGILSPLANTIERELIHLPPGTPASHARAIAKALEEEGYVKNPEDGGADVRPAPDRANRLHTAAADRARLSRGGSGNLLSFMYENHRGDWHHYVVEVEGVEFTDKTGRNDDVARWMLHGMVVTRDGDARPEMNPDRRRSFLLTEIVGPTEWPRR